MVKTAKASHSRAKLLDSFDFVFDIDLVNASILRDMYRKEMLSAKQIAKYFNVSKSKILDLLKEYKIKAVSNDQRKEINYRFSSPPYGYKVANGKLVRCAKEIKIIRQILKLKNQENLVWEKIANKLNESGFKTRSGGKWWPYPLPQAIYKRWNGKI